MAASLVGSAYAEGEPKTFGAYVGGKNSSGKIFAEVCTGEATEDGTLQCVEGKWRMRPTF